jgi:hypothetical protein
MIEVHIPKDLDEYKMPFFMGLQLKHCIYIGIALAVAIPNGLLGHHIMPEALVVFINIIIGGSFALLISNDLKAKRNMITGEETLMNSLHFSLTRRMREYEYMDYIALWDNTEERKDAVAAQLRKKETKRKPRRPKGK